MKTKQLSWGFFLITAGILFLLTKHSIIKTDFSFVWNIWPLILIFWGIIIIFKNHLAKLILSAFMGIFLAVMIFGITVNLFSNFDWSENKLNDLQQNYFKEYDSTIKLAKLNLKAGAGRLEIGPPTDKLINIENFGSLTDYELNVSKKNSIYSVNFGPQKSTFHFSVGKIKSRININLNENPIWDLELNFGAVKSKFDLSYYKIRNLEMNTGASSIVIKLGDKFDSTNVDINLGAAKLEIYIPKDSGCQLQNNMFPVLINFDVMKKKNANFYETENFAQAKKKILIRLNGGVSSIKIFTY
ncbi:MAG: DUF5668 domain-containing protein [Melioribacter sp.]|nr:DUF5668 domain-containing protein [Melioribacter sp.]